MLKKIFSLILSILLVFNSLAAISFSNEIDKKGSMRNNNFNDVVFSDVSKKDWFYDSVKFVYQNHIMKGISKEKFAPNKLTTRAMIVTMLYRLDDATKVLEKDVFSDVENGAWYYDAVKWASNNHIVNGYGNNTFRPNKNITREELCKILYNTLYIKNIV